MEILENHKEIFDNAIKAGILSNNEADAIYAGNFMYMYSENDKHFFKNKNTRKYGFDKETILNTCDIITTTPEVDKHLGQFKSNIMDRIIDAAVYLKVVIRFKFSSKFYQTIKRTKCKLFGYSWVLSRENNKPYFCKSCTKLFES